MHNGAMSSTNLMTGSHQQFVDKQMAGVIESIMVHSYSLANRGIIPSDAQLVDYIDQMEDAVVLDKVRKHPAAASTKVLAAEDAEVLRWSRLVGQRSTS